MTTLPSVTEAVAVGVPGQFAGAFQRILGDLLAAGSVVEAGDGKSVGSGRSTRELLNYGFTLADGRDRLLVDRSISAIGAVGRFVWMLSGSDRLADIAYYEPKVKPFTDDGLSVPGSDYGARLFNPRPGLDQVRAATKVLREELGSRRAAAAVYLPEDAGRESRDIPCTFGLSWQVRDGLLNATTIMRSNNAWTLLPYNVFEFSLLGELIAADLGVSVGRYHHFAVSMHLYEDHVAAAETAISLTIPEAPPRLPPVPMDDVWGHAHVLSDLEVALRYAAAGLDDAGVLGWLHRAAELGPFWSDLAIVLLGTAVRNRDLIDSALTVIGAVDEPWKSLLAIDLREQVERAAGEGAPSDAAALYMPWIRSLITQPPSDSKND